MAYTAIDFRFPLSVSGMNYNHNFLLLLWEVSLSLCNKIYKYFMVAGFCSKYSSYIVGNTLGSLLFRLSLYL